MANGETLTAANDAVQDNPVGITEKYIYIIRNDINDKVYIGQAIDPEERFRGHINDARRKCSTSAIDGAIYKYGAEHFYYEILENKTPDYNEREKYWISFFNSKCPNGYNIMDGGDDPPVRRGFNNNRCKFDKEDIPEIRRLLLNPSLSMMDIAKHYGVTYKTISYLNKGYTYRDNSIDYPIRKFVTSGEYQNFLSSNVVNAIIYDIKNTNDSLRQIAQRYHVNQSAVAEINDGSVYVYRREWLEYPLRDSPRVSPDTVNRIKRQLMDGVMSKNQIASVNRVTYAIVSNINSGRDHFDENLIYPLKRHEGRLDYDESVWEEVRSRLKRGDDPKKITAALHLPNISIVHDINKGKTHRSGNYQYPIRTFEKKVSDEMIRQIASEIKNSNKSFAVIGNELGVHKSTVQCVNVGKTERYHLPDYTYPIRKHYR